MPRREFVGTLAALPVLGAAMRGQSRGILKPSRLSAGDTVGLV